MSVITSPPAALELPLPPGTLPVDVVRGQVRRFELGLISADVLIAAVDRHGEALEREIERKLAQHAAEFLQTVNRLEVLHGYMSTRVAQTRWLKRWPDGPAVDPVPVACRMPNGAVVAAPVLLAPLHELELAPQLLTNGAGHRAHDGRRGAAASMAAIADAGVSTSDVALALGVDRRKAWAVLNGQTRAPPDLREVLEPLVGVDQAAVVIDGIPQHSRARAPASRAVEALHETGAVAGDLAEVMQVLPSTVRRYLRGTLPPSPKLRPALDQVVGPEGARHVLELIPSRNGAAGPVRKEVRVARWAIGSLLKYRDSPAALTATRSDVERWQQLAELAAAVLAAQ